MRGFVQIFNEARIRAVFRSVAKTFRMTMYLDADGLCKPEQLLIPTILVVDDNPAILEWTSRNFATAPLSRAEGAQRCGRSASSCASWEARNIASDRCGNAGNDGIALSRTHCAECPKTRTIFSRAMESQ